MATEDPYIGIIQKQPFKEKTSPSTPPPSATKPQEAPEPVITPVTPAVLPSFENIRSNFAQREGLRYETYDDATGKPIKPGQVPRGNPTVGIGFNLNTPNAKRDIEALGLDYNAVRDGAVPLNDEQVDTLFRSTLHNATEQARALFPALDTFTPARQEALVDVVFNMGPGAVAKFPKMVAAVNSGNWELAARELLSGNRPGTESKYLRDVGQRALVNAKALRDNQEGRSPPPQQARFGVVAKTPADEAVKAQALAGESQLPLDVVQRNIPEVEKRVKTNRYMSIIQASPATREFLNDAANLAVAHDDVENMGTFETLARGMGERIPALLGGLVRLAGKVVDPIADPAGDFLQRVLPLGDVKINLTGSGPVIELVPHTPREGQGTLTETARSLEGVSLGYQQMTSFEDFLDSPLSNFLPFALEQGIVSLPDMAAILTAFPAYVAARTGELGQTRAVNDGRVDATVRDLMIAAPAALTSAMLDRIGARQMLGLKPSVFVQGRKALTKVTTATVTEAGTEATQEGIELLAEQAGTERGITPEDVLMRMGAGAVGGAGFGATVRTATLPLDRFHDARIAKQQMDRLNQTASESRLKGRAPAKANSFHTAVLERAGINEVSVSAPALLEWAQAHETGPEAALHAIGVNEARLTDAMEDGGDLTITSKAFVENILGTPGYAQVANNLRMVRGQETVTEAVIPLLDSAQELSQALEADTTTKPNLKARTAKLLQTFLAGDPKAAAEELAKIAPDVEGVLARLTKAAAVEKAGISETARRGKLARLDSEISSLDDAIVSTADALIKAENEGRGTVRLSKRLDALQAKREVAMVESETLSSLSAPQIGVETAPVKGPVDVNAATLDRLNVRVTRQQISGVRAAFRQGFTAARANIKEVQNIVTRLIKDSGLAPEIQAQFLSTIKNIQTTEQLNKQLGVLQARVLNALQKQRRKELMRGLKKVVKGTKASSKSGKKVGRYDANAQSILDIARSTLELSRKAAEDKLITLLANPHPTPEQALEGRILAIVSGDPTVSNDEIEATLVDLQAVRDDGRAAGKLRIGKRRARRAEIVEEAIAATTQGQSVQNITHTGFLNRLKQRVRNSVTSLGSWWNGWDELLDISFNKKGVDATSLIDRLRVTKQLQAVKGRIIQWQKKLDRAGLIAFDLKTQKQLMDRFYEDSKRVNLGTFLNANGVEVTLEYSVAEARKLYMELQDPTIAEALMHEDGNAMAQDMVDAVMGLLKQDDIMYAEAQLVLYREMYPDVNAVYRELYGVNLPFNEFYSPIQRDQGSITSGDNSLGIDSLITDEQTYRRQLPGQVKRRTANMFPLLRRSDIGAMHRYMHDMAHFIETAEQVSDLRAVFSNPALKKALTEFHGKSMVGQINKFLEDLGTGYALRGQVFEELFAAFNRRFATSVLALKPTIGIKQLTSWFAMADGISTADFIAGNIAFFKNPRAAITLMYNSSPAIQKRGSSLDFDLAKLGALEEPVFRFKHATTVTELMMAFIRYGDRVPVYAGGYAVYQSALKNGKSHEQAIAQVEDAMNSTQQSVDLDKLSDLQRAGAVGRTMTMFMTARLALLRGELRAWRQRPAFLGGRGKITYREFGKRMAYYHFAMPMLIQFIASGFKWDTDKQLVAMLLGQLNAFVIFGDILNIAATEALTDEGAWSQGSDIPLIDATTEMWEGVRDAAKSQDVGDLLEAMDEILSSVGKFVGLPIEQVINITIGGVKIADGDIEEGAKLVLGYSPTVAEESSE